MNPVLAQWLPVFFIVAAVWFGLIYNNKRLDDFKDLLKSTVGEAKFELRTEILKAEERTIQAVHEIKLNTMQAVEESKLSFLQALHESEQRTMQALHESEKRTMQALHDKEMRSQQATRESEQRILEAIAR